MSVTSISSQGLPTSAVSAVHGHHHGHGGAHKAGMDAAASALGMSSSDLQTALKGGQSLSSLAKAKGVSTGDLTNAISSALTKTNPSIGSDRAQQLAQRMVNGSGSASSEATAQS
jgi:hypothetical protein